jgi:hypothetical protein
MESMVAQAKRKSKKPSRQAPPVAPQQVLPESATKPLCDVVAADIKEAVWSLHKYHAERLLAFQRYQVERGINDQTVQLLPPVKEATATLANLVQAAGVAEREAVLAIVGAHVGGDTLHKIALALRQHRGPLSTSNQWAAWSTVGESKDGKVQSHIMALNLGADYALAK